MINIDAFITKILDAAKEAGLEAAEVYFENGDSFEARCVEGEIADYTLSSTGGLSLRGLWKGKMGFSCTEAFDDEAIGQLVNGVIESAELTEDEDVQEIFKGSEHYEEVNNYNPALDLVTEREKLDFVLNAEKKALEKDERAQQIGINAIETSSSSSILRNSYGLSLSHKGNYAFAALQMVAKEDEKVASSFDLQWGHDFSDLNQDKLVDKAVGQALWMLDAEPVESGKYKIVLEAHAMVDLLSTFCGVFSAESAQKGLSLLKDREDEKIASNCVTLCDDPFLKGGMVNCGFDGEGVATYKKNIVENGVLKTLMHNLKTARKAGVTTTANAARAGYKSPIGISPSNFYLVPGEKTLEEMLAEIGDGLVINDLSGLHAGANPVSGDFSLLCEGYTFKNGKKDKPVNQITIAGNFYEVLKNGIEVANDLTFPGSSIGAASLYVGEMSIAGK